LLIKFAPKKMLQSQLMLIKDLKIEKFNIIKYHVSFYNDLMNNPKNFLLIKISVESKII